MCGIASIFSNHGPISAEALQRATKMLHHRGPEVQKQWISENGRIGLGHARLSIIDLAGGDQPLTNEDESIHLVANGEIYDFERIQRELTDTGHHLRTKSDSEVILHLYEDFGVHCLQRLRGEYAFALWDRRNKTLFAARDRFGVKPLFYAIHNNQLYLASEVKALFAAGVPAAWDDEAFFRISKFMLHPGANTRTLFKGVYQVPAAHYLLASGDQLQILPYWDYDYPTADKLKSVAVDDATHVAQLTEVLDEAVRLRMRADVPVGCYLSGGLDSCAVLGLAARHSSRRIQAFTLSFDHKDYDERHIAEEMAKHAGADFHPIDVSQAQLTKDFADAVWHSENVFFNAHGVAKFALSRAVRDAGFKVVLTGEGADEMFAGYPHFRRDAILYNSEGQDPEVVRQQMNDLLLLNRASSGSHLPHGESESLDGVKRILGFVPSWLESFGSSASKLTSMLSKDFASEYSGTDPYRDMLNRIDVRGQLTGRDPVNQSLYLWGKLSLQTYVLNVLGDRMEMAHSIEGRVPFLDHKVAELAREMPITQKIRGKVEKYVVRQAVKPFITPTVLTRHKHPFRVPPSTLRMDQPMGELIQDTLRCAAFASVPFFDQAKVVSMLDAIPKMEAFERVALDTVLMVILSTTILQQRFGLSA